MMNRFSKLLSALAAFLLLVSFWLVDWSRGECKQVRYKYEAVVLWVHDGDTVTVQDNKQMKHKLRLYAIDAPELAQSGGKESLQHLIRLLPKQVPVWVEVENKDRYGREVATIYRDNMNINRQQIAAGQAWHYKQYDRTFVREYGALEQQARERRLGLWHYPNAKAPWEYRKAKREKK